MTLKQYFPLSIAIFVAVVSLVEYLDMPVAPFALVLLVAETLVGFELEDHKVPKFLAQIFQHPKPRAH